MLNRIEIVLVIGAAIVGLFAGGIVNIFSSRLIAELGVTLGAVLITLRLVADEDSRLRDRKAYQRTTLLVTVLVAWAAVGAFFEEKGWTWVSIGVIVLATFICLVWSSSATRPEGHDADGS